MFSIALLQASARRSCGGRVVLGDERPDRGEVFDRFRPDWPEMAGERELAEKRGAPL
jgi:hypothetical protein